MAESTAAAQTTRRRRIRLPGAFSLYFGITLSDESGEGERAHCRLICAGSAESRVDSYGVPNGLIWCPVAGDPLVRQALRDWAVVTFIRLCARIPAAAGDSCQPEGTEAYQRRLLPCS